MEYVIGEILYELLYWIGEHVDTDTNNEAPKPTSTSFWVWPPLFIVYIVTFVKTGT